MAYLEFDISTGDNLNSGIFGTTNTYSGSGDWDGTSVFTPNDGSTPASFITQNVDYVSIYVSGDTVCRYVALATTVAAGVNGAVTLSTTLKYGTVPASTGAAHTSRLRRGGAWASMAGMTTPGVLNAAVAVPQSTRLNIKAGTYANTTNARAIGMTGTTQFPFRVQGYLTNPGDQEGQFQAVAGTSIPAITFTTANLTGSADITMVNLDITSAFTGATLVLSSTRWKLQEVRLANTSSNAGAIALSASALGTAVECYFSCPSTATKTISCTTGISAYRCSTISGGITGLLSTVSVDVDDCLFINQAGDGISTSTTIKVDHTDFYNQTGNGINMTTTGAGSVVANCYFSTITTAAKACVNNTSGTNTQGPVLYGNAAFNVTAMYSGFQEAYQFQDGGVLGSEAFIAPGSNNFGKLAVGQNIALPSQFENLSTTLGFADVGAAHGAHANRSRSFSGF